MEMMPALLCLSRLALADLMPPHSIQMWIHSQDPGSPRRRGPSTGAARVSRQCLHSPPQSPDWRPDRYRGRQNSQRQHVPLCCRHLHWWTAHRQETHTIHISAMISTRRLNNQGICTHIDSDGAASDELAELAVHIIPTQQRPITMSTS
jgi:hypothetical protein